MTRHRALTRLTDLEAARALILERVERLRCERVSLAESLGRVLAEPIVGTRPHPPRDDSAMDGYAVRSEDLAAATREEMARLPVAGTSVAGAPSPPALLPGCAIRIFTGAPIPAGADAVVRQEAATPDGGDVLFWSPTTPGANIRRAGEDFAAGAEVVPEGTTLGPGEITALAAVGAASVEVYRRPTVAIVTTGDELTRPGETIGAGQIYDANGAGIAAAVLEAGGVPRPLGPIPDDRAALAEAIDHAAEADVVITVAGISVGDRDFVEEVLADRGVEWVIRGVKMRPGKAASFGWLGARPVFGLPGNPAAALVAFEVLVRAALRKMAGVRSTERVQEPAMLDRALATRGGSDTFVRGVAWRQGVHLRFRPLDRQGAGMLTSMIGFNAIARIPAGVRAQRRGERVDCWLMGNPPREMRPRLVAVVGASGSGKTTLLERLIEHLRIRGVGVAVLKHAGHGFELDIKGKDSHRLREAGAEWVALAAPNDVALFGDAPADPIDWALRAASPTDLFLLEGFHDAPVPKIIVSGGGGLEARDREVLSDAIALVGPAELLPSLREAGPIPVFDRDDPDELASLLASGVPPG